MAINCFVNNRPPPPSLFSLPFSSPPQTPKRKEGAKPSIHLKKVPKRSLQEHTRVLQSKFAIGPFCSFVPVEKTFLVQKPSEEIFPI